ncbi:transcription factor SPT20 homolog isoform X2 [Momordica charantia]|uniref:Transcription factor SPT20 homolog isoform X2 n=1 Tax=Momordica charantia TaxID=3673 RepID=A0A6J1D2K2_MOMCH|nr:transcription factor SPT20 homolog isoform X2 [Momordica charantia]
MASGSAGRPNSASKTFDFGTDDILCSYEDYGNQDSSNGSHSDLSVANSGKDFHKSRMSAVFPAAAYGQPEDSIKQDLISTVENSMKKYSDNILRFLEGISSRLSQLELNCYNLDKSIGEMRSDLIRDHEESDSKLKSLEKHIQEVHRSVQIIRDKQELAETQKDLAKLHLLQKESSSSSHSHSNDERASPVASDPKKNDNLSENNNQQLALALPHQIVPQQNPITPPPPAAAMPQNVPQQQSYYISSTQLPSQPTHIQHAQSQYQQFQDASRLPSQMTNSQLGQTPPPQQFNQYQQQWTPPQPPQQVQPPQQQPSMQPQIRPPPTSVYASYALNQPTSMPETLPNSMPMQVSFSSIPQPGSSRMDALPYGYSGSGGTVPQQPPQVKNAFGPAPGEGYLPSGPQSALSSGGAYMMYDRESGRPAHHHPQPQQSPAQHPPQPQQPHFNQSGYPPANSSLQIPQHPTGSEVIARNFMRNQNHPYSDIVEKLMGMGFRGDHVASVIHRMEVSGQPIDFNAVLDGLSNSGGPPQRVW